MHTTLQAHTEGYCHDIDHRMIWQHIQRSCVCMYPAGVPDHESPVCRRCTETSPSTSVSRCCGISASENSLRWWLLTWLRVAWISQMWTL